MDETIDLTGLDPSQVLKALYDAARAQGMGLLHFTAAPLRLEEAQTLLQGREDPYFDYLHGRVLKIDLGHFPTLNPALYDRDNGPGAAQAAIAALRQTLNHGMRD